MASYTVAVLTVAFEIDLTDKHMADYSMQCIIPLTVLLHGCPCCM